MDTTTHSAIEHLEVRLTKLEAQYQRLDSEGSIKLRDRVARKCGQLYSRIVTLQTTRSPQ